jgi:hypothetical protein
VIVAVIVMWMMQLAAYEVIDMVAMRYCLVPAVWTMLMRASGFRCAAHGICGAHRNHMFVDVILMHVVEMAVVKIVHMAIVEDRGMSTVRAVLMGVVGMVLLSASGHGFLSLSSIQPGLSVIAFPQRVSSRFAPIAERGYRKAHNRCALTLVAV